MPTFAHWAEFFWTRPYTRPRTPADADQRSCNQRSRERWRLRTVPNIPALRT